MTQNQVGILGVLLAIALIIGGCILTTKLSAVNYNNNVCSRYHAEHAFEYVDSNRNCYNYKCKNCNYIIHIWNTEVVTE